MGSAAFIEEIWGRNLGVTYSPALINNFQQLKTLFTGEKELAELDRIPEAELVRPKDYRYFNRWQVAWIIATAPFAVFAYIFLKAVSILCWSNRLDLIARRTIRNIDYLQTQWKFGSSLWVPTDNEYRSDLNDVFDLPSVKRKAILDPLIKSNLHPDLKRVNYNRIGKGLCWGASNWFNFLVLKKMAQTSLSIEQVLVAVAKQFEEGQPRQAALLQSFNGLECDLLDLSSVAVKNNEKDGVYVLSSEEHCISYIKWEGKEFVWDARDGLIVMNTIGEHSLVPRQIILQVLRGSCCAASQT